MVDHLREHEAHLWLLQPEQVTDASQLERCAAMLSDVERAAWQRFHFERDRHTYLVSHALTRCVLSRYSAVQPSEWQFVRNQYGRPEIANQSDLRFNLSHTKGLVACVTTTSNDVGVDVETRKRMNDLRAIAERFFSPAEVRELLALPTERQRNRFFELWTLKESYIKGRGMGLALPLDRFSFTLGGEVSLQVDPSLQDDGRQWLFGLDSPTPDHQLAWAVRDPTATVTVRWFPLSALAA